jgi:hypothetical protein
VQKSTIKRRLEPLVRGGSCQRRGLRLKSLTHNDMILIHIELVYIAGRTRLADAFNTMHASLPGLTALAACPVLYGAN